LRAPAVHRRAKSRTALEQATQLFAAVSLFVIGLSHLFQPKAWVVWFQALAARGTVGAFTDGFICLSFGAMIVGFHNVWEGPAMVLTLIGWAQVMKALGRFLAPQLTVHVMQKATMDRAWIFQAGGIFALALSGFLWWLYFFSV